MNLAELKNYLVIGLQGSCTSLYEMVDWLSEEDEKLFYDNEDEILDYIENRIFQCEQCSWWGDPTETYDALGKVMCEQCMREG